jgi:hypothetical protein
MKRVFPERDFVEVPDGDQVFHVLCDLKDRCGIPGEWSLRSGVPYLNGGCSRYSNWDGQIRNVGQAILPAAANPGGFFGQRTSLHDRMNYGYARTSTDDRPATRRAKNAPGVPATQFELFRGTEIEDR